MPESNSTIDVIHNSLKASLHRGKSQHDLDQDVAAASKRVLLEKIIYVPASSPYTMQIDQLRAKYISLNAGAGTSAAVSSKSLCSSVQGSNLQNGNSLPLPRVILYPEEKITMDWPQQGRIGAGLVNMGNTCFFNSTLQCLTYTAPLAAYCLSGDHKQNCTKNGFCMMCEIQDHIRMTLKCGGKSLKPHSMLQKLRCIAKHMRWGRQEDAHEFLRFVVDHLQQSCLQGHTKLDARSKETTVINQIFGGYLQSQVTCFRCQAKSNTFDPFMDISLDIKGIKSVEEAFVKYVKPETLDQDNAYKCPKCKHKVRAQKRLSIHKAPNILTLQLNRFDLNRHFSGKINQYIRFTEKLNLRPFMSQRQGEPILYHLYGVIVHSGYSSDCGHYYSFVKSPSKVWYCMNDASVHQAGSNAVFGADAYVLFYARINRGANGSASCGPAAGSHNYQSDKTFASNKGAFIGPVAPGKIQPHTAPQVANGLHGTPSSEQGTPIKRQQASMLPRSLQQQKSGRPADSSRPSGSLNNYNSTNSTPHATAASALPGSHGHISFSVQSHLQKRFNQPQLQDQTVEDSKRNVVQIKHGNSMTMEKSPNVKSDLVDSKGDKTVHKSVSNNGSSVITGLVPYKEDDSDSDSQKQKHRDSMSGKGDACIKNGTSNKSFSKQPLYDGLGDAIPTSKKINNGHPPQSQHSKLNNICSNVNPSKLVTSSSLTNLTNGSPISQSAQCKSTSANYASSVPSKSLLLGYHQEERKPYLNGQHPFDNTKTMTPSKMTPGKACSVVPLELPTVVNVSTPSSASSSKMVTPSGIMVVQPRDVSGCVPSPRGSCSSANSVNSTHEWTLQSNCNKDKTEKGSYFSCKPELQTIKSRLFKTDTAHKSVEEKSVKHEISSNEVDKTKKLVSSHKHIAGSAVIHHPSSVSSSTAINESSTAITNQFIVSPPRSKTPVNISDRQSLLSTPPSSQTSESSRKSKKHKKKKKHKLEEVNSKSLSLTNGHTVNEESSRSTSVDSSSQSKKKRSKHKKEEKKRFKDSSSSESDSDRVAKTKKHKKRQYHRDSTSSSDDSNKKHKHRKRNDVSNEDSYEWVEVTKETSDAKHKSSKASVQTWNHYVKDDVAPCKESDVSKIKSTWDGSRQTKVSSALHGSSTSFRSNVLSWDGGKNHIDRDAQADKAKKRQWSDDYNEEIDAGKVKKSKKHKFDDDFGSNNPFQQYQSDKRDNSSTWSQDHSYHQPRDGYKNWHNNDGRRQYKQSSF